MRGLFAVAGVFALVASCGFAPKPKDGKLPCDHGCPGGYVCRTDNHCWRANSAITDSGVDGANVNQDTPTAEVSSIDSASPPDTILSDFVRDVSVDSPVVVDVETGVLGVADSSTIDAPMGNDDIGRSGGSGGNGGSTGGGGGGVRGGEETNTGDSEWPAVPDVPGPQPDVQPDVATGGTGGGAGGKGSGTVGTGGLGGSTSTGGMSTTGGVSGTGGTTTTGGTTGTGGTPGTGGTTNTGGTTSFGGVTGSGGTGAGGACNTDGGTRTCPSCPRRAFVTSQSYHGNFGGLAAADSICQAEANAAGLCGTWMAWLADETKASPSTRFTRSNSGYVRPDGVGIASSWTDLTDGSLLAPLNVTASGVFLTTNNRAWTDVDFNGAAGWASIYMNFGSCNSWTSVTSGFYAGTGLIGATDTTWTVADGLPCDGLGMQYNLYCFEQ